jgi:hypothetical protein
MAPDDAPARATLEKEVDIFVAAYEQQCEQSRHYENQHLTITGFVLTGAGVVVTLATFDEKLSWRDAWLGGSVVCIGIFGLLASIAYYARTTRHAKRAEELRFRLDAMIHVPTLTDLRGTADARTAKKLKRYFGLQLVRLHHVWIALDCVVLLIGIILTALALGAE